MNLPPKKLVADGQIGHRLMAMSWSEYRRPLNRNFDGLSPPRLGSSHFWRCTSARWGSRCFSPQGVWLSRCLCTARHQIQWSDPEALSCRSDVGHSTWPCDLSDRDPELRLQQIYLCKPKSTPCPCSFPQVLEPFWDAWGSKTSCQATCWSS